MKCVYIYTHLYVIYVYIKIYLNLYLRVYSYIYIYIYNDKKNMDKHAHDEESTRIGGNWGRNRSSESLDCPMNRSLSRTGVLPGIRSPKPKQVTAG